MNLPKKNILITGYPGIGKTTLIKQLINEFGPYHPVGFYTEEIREKDVRHGFEIISIDGRRKTLAHTSLGGEFRVGRYGIDVYGFENFISEIVLFNSFHKLIVIDEIGRMECLSPKFRALIRRTLNSKKALIATIALRGRGIIEEIKQREDVGLLQLTLQNRESLFSEISGLLRG